MMAPVKAMTPATSRVASAVSSPASAARVRKSSVIVAWAVVRARRASAGRHVRDRPLSLARARGGYAVAAAWPVVAAASRVPSTAAPPPRRPSAVRRHRAVAAPRACRRNLYSVRSRALRVVVAFRCDWTRAWIASAARTCATVIVAGIPRSHALSRCSHRGRRTRSSRVSSMVGLAGVARLLASDRGPPVLVCAQVRAVARAVAITRPAQ